MSGAAPKPGIVWMASFPKSGNTWTRAFLHNLAKILGGEDETQDINQMGRFSTWEIRKPNYTEILGFEPTDEHRAEIAAARHRVQQRIADDYDGLVFVKTHQALVMDRGYSTINFAVTSGAIYIVRNPLDVAISYAHHMSRSIDETIESMGTRDVETSTTDKAVYEVYGSWSQHVHSWTRKPHPSIYVMRYEDMVADPVGTFGGLARHMLLEATPDQLAEAIDRSSFAKLRAQEERDGFRERPESAARFFREGRLGQWRDVLTPAQVDRLTRDHGEEMARFGYLPG
jgi:Sulfotransferase domain